MNTLGGGCHCGRIRYELETALAPEQLPRRACQCSFCSRHGAISTADPEGRARFHFSEPDVIRYRFGLKISDFLICRHCGIYVGAVMDDGTGPLTVINANTLDDVDRLTQPVKPMDYGAEDETQRKARRRERWMPAFFNGVRLD